MPTPSPIVRPVTIPRPPGIPSGINLALPAAAPLLMLPLRLEYTWIEKDTDHKTVDRVAEKAMLKSAGQHKMRRSPLGVKPIDVTEQQIWFRWYPDDNFSESGAREASAREQTLLKAHGAMLGTEKWWDMSKPQARNAWLSLAADLGPQRALHLLRHPGNASLGGDARTGRIAALPKAVELFASKNGVISSLGMGKDIPANKAVRSQVCYSFEAVESGGWLCDFTSALELGMGLIVSDPVKVQLAIEADWIIATGVSGEDGKKEMEAFLKDQAANGKFELLEQDSPTNNSPDELSVGKRFVGDAEHHLLRATHAEAGLTRLKGGMLGSSLLADALGLDSSVTDRAINAADTAWEDARAMLQVLGPVLLDTSVDNAIGLDGVTEQAFLSEIVASMAARGVLPVLRIGRNPYGIAPVTRLNDLAAQGANPKDAERIRSLLKERCISQKESLIGLADDTVPVVRPGDSDAAETLSQVLSGQRVSARLDVANGGSDEVKPIGCPYVVGKALEHQPTKYLDDLLKLPLSKLSDPDSSDNRAPLLYRLALLSLKKITTSDIVRSKIGPASASMREIENLTGPQRDAIKTFLNKVNKLSQIDLQKAKGDYFPELGAAAGAMIERNKAVARGLLRLVDISKRAQGNAQLEILMMETIDLLQYRVDAWASGLAYQRIRHLRDDGVKGLNCGWYGFLSRLRPPPSPSPSLNPAGSSYLRVPSMAQTGAAALLYSAYLRNRDGGAFAINLSSHRARHALTILDYLNQGLTLGAALGLVGERYLNDSSHGPQIILLRQKFPIQTSGQRLFDALAYLGAGLPSASATDKRILGKLTSFLKEQLDSLADLVLAEAVFQRSIGAADAANAWTQVLAGGPVPGEPQFIKSQRQGQGKNFRVAWLLPVNAYNGSNPRAIAEPNVAALCKSVLLGFSSIKVRVEQKAAGNQASTRLLSLSDDLGMEPIDLVMGGRSEVVARSRAAARCPIDSELTLKDDDAVIQRLFADAFGLKEALGSARPLEPSDMSAAASPRAPLDESAEQVALTSAVKDLCLRLTKLKSVLSALIADHANDEAWLLKASYWGECSVLSSSALDISAIATSTRERLESRLQLLTRAEDNARSSANSSAKPIELRASLNLAVNALQECLDGESLIILPQYVASNATIPLVGDSVPFEEDDWFKSRPKLAKAGKCLQAFGGLKSCAVNASAIQGDGGADVRPLTVAPRSSFDGKFIGNDGDLSIAPGKTFLGLVLDEWSMNHPAGEQTTGVVIHHDSPQAQAPACLILAAPPNSDLKIWTPMAAAGMVQETIEWMKIRALATMYIPPTSQLLPGVCQVPMKKGAPDAVKRIPEQMHTGWSPNSSLRELININLPLDALNAMTINERPGFTQ
jgi:hypothetical protein